ncbi:hypothetical protein FDB29_03590 [Clostridium botulinum]|nr:hypothetical protein [Clostridium botulinum]
MARSDEISIIVQGAINEYTKKSLLSIRKNFFNAQIILSTWEDSNVSGLEYDEVVFSKDPGSEIIDDISRTFNNVNRQIVSTKAGLKIATRKYILKTRSDIIWKSDDILSYFGKYDKEFKPKHFFNRILICNYYTRNPKILPLPFHMSDWVAFGCKEDINLFYNIHLQENDEMRWFKKNEKENERFYTNLLVKYVPEQHICLNFVRKFYDVKCDSFYDASIKNITLTEYILANDFVVLNYDEQLNINFPKYNPNRYLEKFTLISNKQWIELYKEYCMGKNTSSYYLRRLRNKVFYLFFIIRKEILVVLHKLHLKEKIKKILGKIWL